MTTKLKFPDRLVGEPASEFRIKCLQVILQDLGPARVDTVTRAYQECFPDYAVVKETVLRSLSRMEQRGQVYRGADADDRRAVLWVLN